MDKPSAFQDRHLVRDCPACSAPIPYKLVLAVGPGNLYCPQCRLRLIPSTQVLYRSASYLTLSIGAVGFMITLYSNLTISEICLIVGAMIAGSYPTVRAAWLLFGKLECYSSMVRRVSFAHGELSATPVKAFAWQMWCSLGVIVVVIAYGDRIGYRSSLGIAISAVCLSFWRVWRSIRSR